MITLEELKVKCVTCGRARAEHSDPSEEDPVDDESAIEEIFKRLPHLTRDEAVDIFESCKRFIAP